MRSAAQKAAWKKLSRNVKWFIKKKKHSVWSRRIRKEFNYECACCGKKTALEAHHVHQRHLHPGLSNDLDNGLLLNTKCHDKIHALYNSDQNAYWTFVNQLILKRNNIKSIKLKDRNPSGHQYLNKDKNPVGYQCLDSNLYQDIVLEELEKAVKKEKKLKDKSSNTSKVPSKSKQKKVQE